MPRSYTVKWFDAWCGELDEALACLPERQCMPHALYRSIMTTQRADATRIALVECDGGPVLIAGLRQRSRYVWEPMGNWHAPGPVFPAHPGHLISGLRALRLEIPLAWWRTGAPPAEDGIRWAETSDTYRMNLDTNPETYWRQTKYLRFIQKSREKCADLTSVVNSPGATEWIIRSWGARWAIGEDPASRADLEDRITTARGLEARGALYSLSLMDSGDIVGGTTLYVHAGDLVAGVMFHKPEYRSKSAGVRLMDLAFEFGAKLGLKAFDVGGKADYKQKLAPAGGTRTSLVIAPRYLYHGRRAVGLARNLYRSLKVRADVGIQAQAVVLGTIGCMT